MKDVEIIEAHAMIDHIHMLVKIPPKMSVSPSEVPLGTSLVKCPYRAKLKPPVLPADTYL